MERTQAQTTRARAVMHLVLSLALLVCFQVTILQAYCNNLQALTTEDSGSSPGTSSGAGTAPSASTTTTTTTACTSSTTSPTSRGQQPTSGSVDQREETYDPFKLAGGRGGGTANVTSASLNQTSTNSSAPTGSTRQGYPTKMALNVYDRFRLEYNKYKILSHLSITGNLDDIEPRVDEELRSKLLTATRIKESLNNDSATSSRRKRALTCDQVKDGKSPCCLDNFYVNFTHIGWDKWILYPPGYHANYCRGKCDLSHARYYHSTLLSKYSNVINLCCSPRHMAPLNLLYIDDHDKVHQKSIPDMVVESCDCA